MNVWIKLYKITDLANSSNGYRVGQNNRFCKLRYKTRKSSLIAIISIVVSALTTIVVKVIMYLLKRRTIPKLVFDGEYKTNSIGGITYFLKVKRDKGEGEAEGVKGFVGTKDKIELKPSVWLIERNIEIDIPTYDYLTLFKILEYNGQKIITFPNANDITPPDFNYLLKNFPYTKFKNDKLIVEIIARRARISKRQIKKKIDNIINKAKPIIP